MTKLDAAPVTSAPPTDAPRTAGNVSRTSDGWAAASLRGVPPSIAGALERAGMPASDCRICVSSSLRRDGTYGSEWLAISPRTVVVVSGDGDSQPTVFSVPIASVRSARVENVTGGGSLIVNTDGRLEEIIRFDASGAGVFATIAHRIQQHVDREGGQTPSPLDERPGNALTDPLDFTDFLAKQRETFCPSCGRQLQKQTRVCPFCVKRSATLWRVLQFAAPYRLQLVVMGVLMLLGTGAQLIPPQIVRILVDDVLPSQNRGMLATMVALLAGIMLVQAAITVARSRLAVWVGSHITNAIRVHAFEHLQRLSLAYFNKQQTGALMSRINNDTRQMQGFLVDGIQFTVVNLLLVVGIMAILLWENPLLAVLVLAPAPIVVTLSTLVWRIIRRRFRILWKTTSAVTAYLNDALSGIRVIKAFGQEDVEVNRYRRETANYRERLIEAEVSWQTLIPILNFLVQSSLFLVWYFGAFQVWLGELTIGGLIMYVGYMGLVYGPLQLLTRLNDWLTRALTAAARVFEVLDTEPDVVDRSTSRSLPAATGRIELRDIVFGYEKHSPVLKHVSVTIEPGEMIGLVGHSGAGKSTLVNLIGRFYDVDEGQILLDGVDVRDIRVEDVRRQLGFVLQNTFLFNGTVHENLAYARPDATRTAVIEAAVAANAHDFIMKLPDAYDTIVGERGSRLSSGEQQRISIARALLLDPKILILDEATSSVDTETEAKIQAALDKLIKGRTTIAIAHRLSTLRHADRLLVIRDGEVAEMGTHDDLMHREDGVYRRLVTIQTEWSRTIGVGG
jgi:ATP-binding cassette subfamily B protein